MSGFKEHLVEILKTNNLLHGDSIGMVFFDAEICEYLYDKYKVLASSDAVDLNEFDYIFVKSKFITLQFVMKLFTYLNDNGILILEITPESVKFDKKYLSKFGNFTGTKVTYDDKTYLIIHSGVDYGN